jgi:hypothetical protein
MGIPLGQEATRKLNILSSRNAVTDPTRGVGSLVEGGVGDIGGKCRGAERVIAQTTGHKSMTVLRRYIREGAMFRENAASAVGL